MPSEFDIKTVPLRQDARAEHFMRMAIGEARLAFSEGEFPVGAVLVSGDNVIARARNARERLSDPTAHAEVLALRAAAEKCGDWRLNGCELFVTLEPCPMCAGAILNARIARVWYGAYDNERGCCGSVYRMTEDPAFNAFVHAVGGVLAEECSAIIDEFLQRHRK